MQKKLINIFLIIAAVAVALIMGRDFIVNKSGKNIENAYEYNIDEFRQVDSSLILYREVFSFPVQVEIPKGIALCENQIYIVAEDVFLKFDREGNLLFRKVLGASPTCIACGCNGEFLVGMRDHIRLFDGEGTLLSRWNSFGENTVITSVVVSGESVFVADAGGRVVYQCDKQGNVIRKIGEKNEEKDIPGYVIPSPYFDVAVDAEGFLWAANTGRHSFENYNADGSLRTSWKTSSVNIEGFSGCCNPAHFAVMDDNLFVTSEKGLVRIKIYDQHGQFKGVVAPPAAFDRGATIAPEVVVDGENRIIALDFERKSVRIFEQK
ncbi:MAG: hypothetical protein A2W90_04160 [Bacteroidetes bacterium GWF2_42_66]|nr:MAG: hypothetical protein A2W92_06975 [Bacteroidetes bacterium GWA2_42_15]OFY02486.1 MAG: hypothetical protein A2W89_21695 [Bacteroidetes bacterium GWE2_42_39]OFY41416.1 MAG: hypothetical protein A2W90_04160 [Bacteroidetes bacterium GWF2_42_66]HBL75379.1 hypothetical protein [Prolixibacteraceae bacterium]HCR90299.1 hypothetical protein [Prolixibacteraceae bacterium]